MFTPEELKNLTVFIEVGAKALSQDKPLRESQAIQSVALGLIEKLSPPEVREPAEAGVAAVPPRSPRKSS